MHLRLQEWCNKAKLSQYWCSKRGCLRGSQNSTHVTSPRPALQLFLLLCSFQYRSVETHVSSKPSVTHTHTLTLTHRAPWHHTDFNYQTALQSVCILLAAMLMHLHMLIAKPNADLKRLGGSAPVSKKVHQEPRSTPRTRCVRRMYVLCYSPY